MCKDWWAVIYQILLLGLVSLSFLPSLSPHHMVLNIPKVFVSDSSHERVNICLAICQLNSGRLNYHLKLLPGCSYALSSPYVSRFISFNMQAEWRKNGLDSSINIEWVFVFWQRGEFLATRNHWAALQATAYRADRVGKIWQRSCTEADQ